MKVIIFTGNLGAFFRLKLNFERDKLIRVTLLLADDCTQFFYLELVSL